jgi:hypothetical protein
MPTVRVVSAGFAVAAFALLAGGCSINEYQVIVTTDGQSLERATPLKVDVAFARNEEDVRKLDGTSVKQWFLSGGRDNIRPVPLQLTLAGRGPDAKPLTLKVADDYDNDPLARERRIKRDIEGLYVFVHYEGEPDAGAKRLIKQSEFGEHPIIEIAIGRTQIADVRFKEKK